MSRNRIDRIMQLCRGDSEPTQNQNNCETVPEDGSTTSNIVLKTSQHEMAQSTSAKSSSSSDSSSSSSSDDNNTDSSDTDENITSGILRTEMEPEDLVESSTSPEVLQSILPRRSDVEIEPHELSVPSTSQVFYGNINEGVRRRRKANKKLWKKNLNKRLRMEGKAYLGYTRQRGEKMQQNKNREERKLGARCESEFCRKVKVRQCNDITEEQRNSIFERFWGEMNWDQRKVFVASHVSCIQKKRVTVENDSRRTGTFQYSLTLTDGDGNSNVKFVCKNMFLNTLCIGAFSVRSWVKCSKHGMRKSSDNAILSRTRNIDTTKIERIAKMHEFFDSLPKMPSHYNRMNTNKVFLEPVFSSISDLYRVYKKYCCEHDAPPFSLKVFTTMFKEKNLSIHKLKKDMCDMCVGYKTGNISEVAYNAHIRRKERAREEKAEDKKAAINRKCIVLNADLQAVKVCPYVTASAIYYKTKLALHNYSVYNLANHHVTCYWFSEVDADLTASTYATLLTDYIKKHCLEKKIPIIIYTDGCTGQNRNNVLSNALLNLAAQHNVLIMQKYLEVGHTQMEGDSVHSAIERKLRNRLIHLPSDYISATIEARQKPFPYEAVLIEHDYVQDFANSSTWRYKSIRPGRKPGDPKVTDIKAILYDPARFIKFKMDFDEICQDLPQRTNNIDVINNYTQLRQNKIPITDTKFKHLQELKSVIPVDCHAIYDICRTIRSNFCFKISKDFIFLEDKHTIKRV